MNEKVLKTLEYNKIIDILIEFADSDPAKEMVKNLVPSAKRTEINERLNRTEDAYNRFAKETNPSFGNNKDFSFTIKSLELQRSLSAIELLKVAGFLANVDRVKNYGEKTEIQDNPDSLSEFFSFLAPLSSVCAEINRCIISEDEISDNASPELKSIRRQIMVNNDKIHSQLNSMLNGSLKTYLQDAVITMRNNRYCLPIKSEYKSQVPGMVHDQSSSGSTFFIEPAAIVNLNNELKELSLKEKEEIEKILASLSVMLAGHTRELKTNCKMMTELDFAFAKAKLANSQQATRPIFHKEHYFNIKRARHPLIDVNKVVPIDISLGKDYNLLIITGPNTGGKTVCLKTTGLLTLMGEAGLFIPAASNSELSIFTEIFADIGDEQSIEQSLSTFSSHMTSLIDILAKADEHSLILMDELGAGTDPTEGAALAIAILEDLRERNIRAFCTTHYSELKVYALQTEGIQNACCEFDVDTLSPTYKLLIGVPGKSNAFLISKKLGLPDSIINRANECIDKDTRSFEDTIAHLEASRVSLDKEKTEINEYKERIKTLEAQLRAKSEKMDTSKDRILREAREEARDIIREAKEMMDESIRDINKAKAEGMTIAELEKSRANLRMKIEEKNKKLSAPKPEAQVPVEKKIDPAKLKKGDMVKIVSMGLKGTVQTLPDKNGNLFVLCGIIRTQTNVKDIIYIDEDAIEKKKFSSHVSTNLSKASSISSEINLLGKTTDEALSLLDKYLDDAYLSHLSSVRVVHGKGTGALRNAVHQKLRKMTYVDSFRLGEFGEGDAGVTIVTFK